MDYGQEDSEQRRAILRALSLTEDSVVLLDDPAAPAPFRLLVGENYDPCFDPAQLAAP